MLSEPEDESSTYTQKALTSYQLQSLITKTLNGGLKETIRSKAGLYTIGP